MGANATTSVPVYASGEVLTAANLNITNSGIPVFATTVTRDAAFGGTGEKTLAQGQTCYIEATSSYQTYNGSAWVALTTAPGLVLVKTQTIGSAVATVTVSDAFSATYDAYKIVVTGGAASSSNTELELSLGASVTGYYHSFIYTNYNNTVSAIGTANTTRWPYLGFATGTNGLSLNIELQNPFLAKYTTFQSAQTRTDIAGSNVGIHQVATSYTSFILKPNAGTLTGGEIRVYGYSNS
jgi:hypothetical protein